MRLVVMFLVGIALAASAQAKPALTRVTVGLPIPMTAAGGGQMAAAQQLGLFAAEGIEPDFIVFQGAGALLPQVAQQKVLIGLPLTEPVLASYDPGNAPLPVQFFYNAIPYNTLKLGVLSAGPIHTIAELKNHAIGVGALTWGTIPQTRALLREAGLQPGVDVAIVPVGVLGSGFQALRTGRVAALNYNEFWLRLLEDEGTPIRLLPFPPVFANMINNAYVANARTVRDQAPLLGRFGRVVTEANLVCAVNPQFCVQEFWRQHPESRPKQGDPARNLAQTIAMLKTGTEETLHFPNGSDRVPGQFDLGVIRAYVAALHRDGELSTDHVPVDKLFTNALVPEFSRFDRDALIARARAARVSDAP